VIFIFIFTSRFYTPKGVVINAFSYMNYHNRIPTESESNKSDTLFHQISLAMQVKKPKIKSLG